MGKVSWDTLYYPCHKNNKNPNLLSTRRKGPIWFFSWWLVSSWHQGWVGMMWRLTGGPIRGEYFTLIPNKIFGKSFPFLVFWGRFSSFWPMILKFFQNSNKMCKLLCRLYGLRVTFGEEFVCSLWEKFH